MISVRRWVCTMVVGTSLACAGDASGAAFAAFGDPPYSGGCTIFADTPSASEGSVRVHGVVQCQSLLYDTTAEVALCAERLSVNGIHRSWLATCEHFTVAFRGQIGHPINAYPDYHEAFLWHHWQSECPGRNDNVYRNKIHVTFNQRGIEEYVWDESPPAAAPCFAP